MAKLSAKQRENLPAKEFGLPEKARTKVAKKETGNYPMPDKGHAISALQRARAQLEAGNLTKDEFDRIDRKARKKLKKKKKKKKNEEDGREAQEQVGPPSTRLFASGAVAVCVEPVRVARTDDADGPGDVSTVEIRRVGRHAQAVVRITARNVRWRRSRSRDRCHDRGGCLRRWRWRKCRRRRVRRRARCRARSCGRRLGLGSRRRRRLLHHRRLVVTAAGRTENDQARHENEHERSGSSGLEPHGSSPAAAVRLRGEWCGQHPDVDRVKRDACGCRRSDRWWRCASGRVPADLRKRVVRQGRRRALRRVPVAVGGEPPSRLVGRLRGPGRPRWLHH